MLHVEWESLVLGYRNGAFACLVPERQLVHDVRVRVREVGDHKLPIAKGTIELVGNLARLTDSVSANRRNPEERGGRLDNRA